MKRGEDIQTRISYYLAEKTDKDQEVLLFGLRLATSFILGYLLLIIFAIPFHALWQTLLASLTVSCFRVISGGAHASAQLRCSLIGVLVIVPIGVVAKNWAYLFNPYLLLLLGFIFISGLFIVYYYVPADTPGKPINSAVQKRCLRALSYVFLFDWVLVVYYCYLKDIGLKQGYLLASILGMYWQIFSLTPPGYGTVRTLDGLLKLIMMERRV